MKYSGVVYGREPDDDFYKIPKQDLEKMKLVDLPVKIEHTNTIVGKVTNSRLLDDGTLMITYELNNDPQGFIADQLTKDGHLTELSLSHIDDGVKKTPTEVSVVFKGARPETKIIDQDSISKFKNQYINPSQTSNNGAKKIISASVTMTSEQMPEIPAEKLEDKKRAVPSIEEGNPRDESVVKRQKTEEVTDMIDAGDRLKVLEEIVAKIPDLNTKKNLYGLTSNLMSEIMEKEELCRTKDDEITNLIKFKENTEADTESNARSTASVIAELLRLYNPNYVKNEALSDSFVKTMSQNPQVYEFLRPLEVCASQIKAERARNEKSAEVDQIEAYRKKCETLQSKLGVYSRMGGHADPNFIDMPVRESDPVPDKRTNVYHDIPQSKSDFDARVTTPVVQVAASAGPTAKDQSDIPLFLRRNLGSYNNGSYGTDRVLPSDFDRPIISKNAQ